MSLTGYSSPQLHTDARPEQPFVTGPQRRSGWYPLEIQLMRFGAGLVELAAGTAGSDQGEICRDAVHAAARLLNLPYAAYLELKPGGSVVKRAEVCRQTRSFMLTEKLDSPAAQLIYHRAAHMDAPMTVAPTASGPHLAERQAIGLNGRRSVSMLPVRASSRPVGLLLCGDLVINGHERVSELYLHQAEALACLTGRALQTRLNGDRAGGKTLSTLETLEILLTNSSAEVSQHSMRMVHYVEKIAAHLDLSSEDHWNLIWATTLHDLGKLAIPEDILHRPGPLSSEEWLRMKRHPLIGSLLIGVDPNLNTVASLVRAHHENFDGSGYPDGLCGNEIPLGSRVLAIVDSYTAMTENRPYQLARSHVEAVRELQCCAGTKYDPELVPLFLESITGA